MTEAKTKTRRIKYKGVHICLLDSKNRVSVPGDFRKSLPKRHAGRVWLVSALDAKEKFLEVWPVPAWDKFCEKVLTIPDIFQLRAMLRGYVSKAIECRIDAQGRILIPPYYKVFAGLDGDVVWLGAGDNMELWSRSRYEMKDGDLRQEALKAMIERKEHFAN